MRIVAQAPLNSSVMAHKEAPRTVKYFHQNCPLCAAPATYRTVDAGNYKHFACPKCTHFQISRRAEKALTKSSQERRDLYASEAPKAPHQQILVIRMQPPEYQRQHPDPLLATFVRKSEVSLYES